jgi:hypothetical protein
MDRQVCDLTVAKMPPLLRRAEIVVHDCRSTSDLLLEKSLRASRTAEFWFSGKNDFALEQGLQDLAEVFGISGAVRFPRMKTKQIPEDFRDWIETKTLEIVAPIAFPPQSPLDQLRQVIIRRPEGGPPTAENHP